MAPPPSSRAPWGAVASLGATALALLLAAGLSCTRPPEPPRPPDLGRLDADVAALITARLREQGEQPDQPGAWMRLGLAYEANALADLAAPCYERVLSVTPGDAKAWYRLALVRSTLGDAPGALTALRRVAALAPSYAPAQVRLGSALADAGDLPGARGAFEAALRAEAGSPAARLGLARTLLQQEDAEGALALLDQAAASQATDARVAQVRAAALRRLGRPTPDLPAAGQRPPPDADPWASEAASSWVGLAADLARAERALQDGHPEQALPLLEPRLGRHGNDATLLTILGAAQVRAGRVNQGLETLRRATALDAALPAAHAELSAALGRVGRPDEALVAAERACALAPCSAEAHESRGIALRLLGRREEAVTALRRAAECDPARTSARRVLGAVLFELRQYEEARRAQRIAVELAPSDAHAWLGLGMSCLELGQLAEAEEALKRAEREGPRREWQVHLALRELARRRTSVGVPAAGATPSATGLPAPPTP